MGHAAHEVGMEPTPLALTNYYPNLPDGVWEQMSTFVCDTIAQRYTDGRAPRDVQNALYIFTGYVDWVLYHAVGTADESVLNEHLIDAFTAARHTEVKAATAERERKVLRTIAGFPNTVGGRSTATSASPTAPYTDAEQYEIRQLRDARIAQRTVWEMRRDGKPKENGDYQMMCPASGPGRTVNCPLKPNQPPVARKGAVLLEVQSPPKAPGKVCTNRKSVKFNQDDDGKYGQYYRYKTEMWRRAHSYGRQVIESFNKSLKHADNILHSSGTRPKRGEAQQAFLALLGTIATNEARINLWMEEHYTDDLKAPDAVTRSGRTKRSNPPRPASRRGKGVSAARAAQLGLPARGARRR